MRNWGDLFSGLLFLSIGLLFFFNRERFTEQALDSGERFWGLFGLRPSSEKFLKVQRLIGITIFVIVGISLILGGSSMLFAFLMGRKFVPFAV
jgi:vacuolar-type H+-ATPase subunit I/STV1